MPPALSPPLILVVLIAPDHAGLDALRPTGETLAAFGVGSEPVLFPPCAPFPGVERGRRIIVAASSDARLPAALAERTGLPVVRVPVSGEGRDGLGLVFDGGGNLPSGEGEKQAFATVATGVAGAKNAALLAVAMLARTDERLRMAWNEFRARQTEVVLQHPTLRMED